MEITKPNEYGKLAEQELINFEKRITTKLPEEYREYQLKYNGGKPFPSDFIISKSDGADSIHHFYGLHNGPTYSRLQDNYEIFYNRMPREIIPIADDPFGNQICIGIKGLQRGKIYFWDHEKESQDFGLFYWLNTKKIANSFNQFLDALFEWVDPDETSVERIIRTNDVDALIRLIDDGYDIETLDEYQRSLIELAAIQARDEMIELLFKKGAQIRNSLSLAENNAQFFEKHQETVKLIKKLLSK